jgi:WD40 repeat protein
MVYSQRMVDDTGVARCCLTGHKETIRSLAISPASRWLASGSEDATVRVWNISTGQATVHPDWPLLQSGKRRLFRRRPVHH